MLKDTDKQHLLSLARESIRHGLDYGKPLAINSHDFSEALQAQRASFVTLHKNGQLRGCIGSLEARQPLVSNVVSNAFNAAFRDPRFPPLSSNEFEQIHIHIEILSTPEPMTFASQADLISQLRPGVDGLVLSDGAHRGTFLPTVWGQLPTPEVFLQHLKNKAGLPVDHWSDTLVVERYDTESFEE